MTSPESFGNYILLERVAIGGMAEIFRAVDTRDSEKRDICIKRILPHYSEDDAFINMFIDEASIAAKLQHINIVQIYDFDTVEGCYYIAMELIDGKDLKQTLEVCAEQRVELSTEIVMVIVGSLCRALGYAHTKEVDGKPLHIVHRDVSPHNVLLGFNDEVRLTDFGIAKAASRLTTTRAGTVKGKCAYMSPEQARGKSLDGRSDIFSIGILMHEMLSNRRLFTGDSDFDILTKVLKEDIVPPGAFRSGLDPEVERICMKALERDRDRRYGSCSEMDDDVTAWIRQQIGTDDKANLGSFMGRLFGREDGDLPTASTPPLPDDIGAIAEMKTAMFDRDALPVDELEETQNKRVVGTAAEPATSRLVTAPQAIQDTAPKPRMVIPAAPGAEGLPNEQTALRESPFIGDTGDQAEIPTQAIDLATLTQGGETNPDVAPVMTPPVEQVGPPRRSSSIGWVIGGGFFLLALLIFVTAVGLTGVYLYRSGAFTSGPTADATPDAQLRAVSAASVRVTSTPSGAKVSLDGEFRGITPTTIEGLEIGSEVMISLELEGYESFEDTVAIEEEMEPLEVVFTKLDFEPDANADAGTPAVDERDANAAAAPDVATSPDVATPPDVGTTPDAGGAQPDSSPTSVPVATKDAGDAVPDVAAVIKDVPPKVDPPALTPEERDALRKKRVEARKRREQQRKDKEKQQGFGTVTINAIPFAQVTLDGKRIGRTPVTRKVSAGRSHSVVLKNAGKKRFRTRFKVGKGEKKTVFHRFK
jgi:serine/threonine protein kinase